MNNANMPASKFFKMDKPLLVIAAQELEERVKELELERLQVNKSVSILAKYNQVEAM